MNEETKKEILKYMTKDEKLTQTLCFGKGVAPLERFIEMGGDPTDLSIHDESIFSMSAGYGHINKVKFLLSQKNIDVAIPDDVGRSAVCNTIGSILVDFEFFDRLECLKLLIDANCPFTTATGEKSLDDLINELQEKMDIFKECIGMLKNLDDGEKTK